MAVNEPIDPRVRLAIRTVATTGTIGFDSVQYKISRRRVFEQVLVIADGDKPGDKITIVDLLGEVLAEHIRPAPGVTYVGKPRRPARQPQQDEPSPKS